MAEGNITEKGAEVTNPVDTSLLYNPQPDGQGSYTDNWITLETLKRSLEAVYNVVTSAESPFNSATLINNLIDTRNGPVTFNLPAAPVAGETRRRITPLANSYETNSLIIGHNGKPIAGVLDDVEVNVNGMALELIFVNDTFGWAVIERGNTMHFQHATVTAADIINKRTDANDEVVGLASDINTMVIGTSANAGNFVLPDSSTVDADKFQMSFLQQGAGAKTFVKDPASSDTILSVGDALTTSGPGSLVNIKMISPGVYLLDGPLVV